MNLSEFLLARIAEDEEEARALPKFPALIPAELVPLIRRMDDQCAHVVADCRAKRRVVAIMREGEWEAGWTLSDRVLGSLALPYADHPDYDEAWKP